MWNHLVVDPSVDLDEMVDPKELKNLVQLRKDPDLQHLDMELHFDQIRLKVGNPDAPYLIAQTIPHICYLTYQELLQKLDLELDLLTHRYFAELADLLQWVQDEEVPIQLVMDLDLVQINLTRLEGQWMQNLMAYQMTQDPLRIMLVLPVETSYALHIRKLLLALKKALPDKQYRERLHRAQQDLEQSALHVQWEQLDQTVHRDLHLNMHHLDALQGDRVLRMARCFQDLEDLDLEDHWMLEPKRVLQVHELMRQHDLL